MPFVNNFLLTCNLAQVTLLNINSSAVRIFQTKNLSKICEFTRKYSSNASAMRFIQFQRNDKQWKDVHGQHLGLLTEDGSQFADLYEAGVQQLSFKHLVQTPSVVNDIQSKLGSLKWEPVTDQISLLSPVTEPEKIICIGLNYLGHCQEQNKEPPKEPMFFSKYASAITGPTGNVILPKITNVSVSRNFCQTLQFLTLPIDLA